MIKTIGWILFCVSLLCHCATHVEQAQAPDLTPSISSIDYTIEPIVFEKKPSLKITLSFTTVSDNTTLALPERWAGQRDYYKDIRDLKVLTPDVSLQQSKEPHLRTILAPTGTLVTISYVLVSGQGAQFSGHRAIITSDYFHIIGHNLFATPSMSQTKSVNISLNWKGFPKKYSFANSFQANQTEQKFSITFETFKEAIFVGGDFRVHEEKINDKPVFIAIRGKWLFSDKEFTEYLHKIIEGQRKFWNDNDFPYFLITLIPNGQACCSSGGSGLNRSFITYMAADQKIGPDLAWLYSHELFHTWNGEKIRRASPEDRYYWFSEGLTNYYARLLNLRAGLINLQDYVDHYNNAIYEYYFSPFKNVPNSQVEKDFFNGSGIDKIPYQRGDLLGHRWNLALKKNLMSLDMPMRDLFAESKTKGTLVSDDVWKRIVARYLKGGIADDVSRFIDAGEAIVPDAEALGPCVKQQIMEVGWFDHSFDRNKTYDSKRITGLKLDSSGYKAGLREGLQLLDRKIIYPPYSESEFKIKDKSGTRWIKFYPIGNEKREIPVYILDKEKFAKDPKACLEWFGA